MAARRVVRLPDGTAAPALGQGVWMMGEKPENRTRELAALRAGMEAGMTLIDTAEMYGNGRSERLVAEAIKETPRERLFIVSKVLPTNASRATIFRSCDASLQNIGTDYLDLYLLHWRGRVPLPETVTCMEELVKSGKIRRWGVSNFDVDDMKELWRVPGGDKCAVNQVLYHLGSRGIEYDLLPWLREHNVPVMAYCPIAQAGELKSELYKSTVVQSVAARHNATVTQVLLAFVLRSGHVIAIPRSSNPAHTKENAAADSIELTEVDMAQLDAAFPAPKHKTHLDIV
ncbi:aldehyde reductase [Leishmania donovani]|uniref:Aldehyde_reductase_-_putative n=3 Tax=Leishmania donovani species complex TaxID=38574 RepID=A0A6L0XX43_LEIIN|nr:putative aldehyde reductase [Leishmania infantum JPCM5]XP_003863383.1 aldehyde reductase, putative [Leishmania donovani]CAC9521489.1 aldehyde_reductase_-_putative [Leishmania infantum]TPP41331.1 Aldo/keto reductase family protein [Leishmania donovani]TPP42475.1 Aldo/keto reductase family protein [Leishmania donovani]CAJ1991497.1 aldehyde reductase [Leishmania donovani]CAM70675.1 putative aldehyde reductase [Leishmania infantum JPCM5]|eukprot:XP_001467611.1 putative aldehyde reductase [Leishmania infantum JPCM5]